MYREKIEQEYAGVNYRFGHKPRAKAAVRVMCFPALSLGPVAVRSVSCYPLGLQSVWAVNTGRYYSLKNRDIRSWCAVRAVF